MNYVKPRSSTSGNNSQVWGAGLIIHHQPTDEFLFFLRDNKAGIPFPNMLDIIGGHGEEDEQPIDCLMRELEEELIDLDTGKAYQPREVKLFKEYIDERRVGQYVFALELDGDKPELKINEGQGLKWLDRNSVLNTKFAFGFEEVLQEYITTLDK